MVENITEFLLNDGLKVPGIGFGTYCLDGIEGSNSINEAIDLDYRLIDTAFNYENEGTVGEAVKKSSVSREELIVTSKLPGRHHSYKEAINTIQESLFRGGLDYYDLYLIHWPNPRINLYVEGWQPIKTLELMMNFNK